MIRTAINGFGRIGRVSLRTIFKHYLDQVEVVAINTSGSMDIEGWAHLLEYDTVYGRFEEKVGFKEKKGEEIGVLQVDQRQIPVLAQREPEKIPWKGYGVEVVVESTGVFQDKESASKHFVGGAQKVIISAPPLSEEIPTYIIGVNEDQYKDEKIISAGSCTTNCVAPIAKVILDNFEIEESIMTTIHAYTADQELVDGSHKDLRRARAAACNIVPTGSGAAQAVISVLPELKGRFAATAIRVPVVCGSYADFTFKFVRKTTVEEVNGVLKKAAEGQLREVVSFNEKPLVSSDVIGSTYSAIIDAQMTKVVSDDLIQIAAWYDNEWAYCCRLLEEVIMVGSH